MKVKTLKRGVFFTLALMAIGCGIPQEKYDADMAALKDEIAQAQGQLADANGKLDEMRNEKSSLEANLANLQNEINRLTGENSMNAKLAAQAKQRLETFRQMLERFRSMVESGKLKIKIVNNKMLVEMASAILFPSGSEKLSDEGKEALAEVAQILITIEGRSFQVAGHTDNVPIKNRKFKSNWDLSAARAVSVVKHLVENGMEISVLSAAGYGETQPVASNDEEEGKAQNRRIEIVLQPNLDELPDLSSLESMVK
jgi:chemotaxis protein MotB